MSTDSKINTQVSESMKSLRRLMNACIVILILCQQLAAAIDPQHLQHRDKQFLRLAKWIQSHDGFIDERVTVRNISINNNTSSYRGIFVNADIRKGDYICFIPWSTIIGAGRWDDEEQGMYDGNFEETAFHLLHELNLGAESQYAPYTDYIRSQRITVPSAWSLPGREFLSEMLGEHLPPRHLERNIEWFVQQYGMDAKTMKAALSVITRAMQANIGSQWLLVPFVDLLNHHSDINKVNTKRFAKSGTGFEIQASKDIKAGSELYTQYWGQWTHYFFEEFGFVEFYPQRWRFEFPIQEGDDHNGSADGAANERVVDVELNQLRSSNSTTSSKRNQREFDLKWFSEFPSDNLVEMLQKELARLERFKRDFANVETYQGTGVPEEELALAWEYHGVLTTAIEEVVDATFFVDKNDPPSWQQQQQQQKLQLQKQPEDCKAAVASTMTSLNELS
jgi:hypothetical protein